MIRSRSTTDEPALDPTVAAELEALDAALRGDAIGDDQLAQLVRDVRAQAPEMPSDLRKRLRHDVSEGFPRGRRAGGTRRTGTGGASGRPSRVRRRSVLAGSGVLVAGAAAVVVMFTLSGSRDGVLDSATSTASSSSSVQLDQLSSALDPKAQQGIEPQGSAASSASAPGSSSTSTEQGDTYLRGGTETDQSATAAKPALVPFARATPSPSQKLRPAASNLSSTASSSSSSSGSVGVAKTRQVERAVDMAVRVKSGKLDDAVAKVGQIARASGGYVSDSQSSLRTRGAGSARFTLRVASAKLDDAVAQLSALGTVTHQDQQSTDITSSFDSVQSRLDDATKVRAALLRALGKATTAGEIASLRTRIADNRAQRAALGTQLSALQRRADLTTVALTLSAPTSGAAAAIDDDGSWSLGDAVHDTGRILGTVTGGLLVAAGAALPFAILALISWPVYRARRRRNREAALGA